MKRISIFVIVVLTLGCFSKNEQVELAPNISEKEYADLNKYEQLGVLSQIGEEFRGDYRKYSGQNEDSTKVQLCLNKDKRFAIGFKHFFSEKIGDNDSIKTFALSSISEFKNLCVGRWTDEGKMIKLKIVLGQSAFFDSIGNETSVKIIDDKTVMLDKTAKEVWISRALCKRL